MPNKNPFEKLPNLDPEKVEALLAFSELLREANQKVNLLSRKDMDDVEYRHVAFCAAISEFFKPADGAKIADVGSGGGLPGIVMAILYPPAKIFMFDGVGKKIAGTAMKAGAAHSSKIRAMQGSYKGVRSKLRSLAGEDDEDES